MLGTTNNDPNCRNSENKNKQTTHWHQTLLLENKLTNQCRLLCCIYSQNCTKNIIWLLKDSSWEEMVTFQRFLTWKRVPNEWMVVTLTHTHLMMLLTTPYTISCFQCYFSLSLTWFQERTQSYCSYYYTNTTTTSTVIYHYSLFVYQKNIKLVLDIFILMFSLWRWVHCQYNK